MNGPIQGVIYLSQDDLARLIGDMHYTDLLKIELPLFNDISNANESLKGAIKNLKSSAEKFSAGDVRAALVDIRNAILNHLTDGGTKKQRVLKKELRDKYMSEVPLQAITSYKKVLASIETELTSILNVVHKFVHVDDERLLLVPLREDLELIYFSVALVARHLGRRLSFVDPEVKW